jgi:hypothetical protein
LGLAQITFSIFVVAFAQSKLAECTYGSQTKDIAASDMTILVFILVPTNEDCPSHAYWPTN